MSLNEEALAPPRGRWLLRVSDAAALYRLPVYIAWWQRVYLNTDITAWVSRGWVKFLNPVSGDGPIFVGSQDDWTRAPLRVACGRREGHDFARVVSQTLH